MNANINDINKAFAVIAKLTAEDMLAIRKAAKLSKHGKVVDIKKLSTLKLTFEDKKALKNAKQRAFRATPEGREYANEASRKSLAAKKHAEAVKALIIEKINEQKLKQNKE